MAVPAPLAASASARALAGLRAELDAAGWSAMDGVAAVGAELIRRHGAPPALLDGLPDGLPDRSGSRSAGLRAAVAAAADLEGADLEGADGDSPPGSVFGHVYEALLGRERRRRAGAFFTPPAIAAGLVERAWPQQQAAVTVWDPAVGGGAFLLAAAEAMLARGDGVAAAVEHLWGTDIDAGAVGVARVSLRWWAWRRAGVLVDPAARLLVADALVADPPIAIRPEGGVDLVVGNPPFLGQLRRHSARSDATRIAAAARFGVAGRGYVDDALLFLLGALAVVRPGGRVALVLPEPVLATAHAEHARRAIGATAELRGLWLGGAAFPGVGVRVCAPVLERHAPAGGLAEPPAAAPAEPPTGGRAVLRWAGETFTPLADGEPPLGGAWAPLLLGAPGAAAVPEVSPQRWSTGGSVGDLATATAGFRDQYYGLVPHVREGAGERDDPPGEGQAPLVTVGMIDPLACHWGERAVRFGGHRWQRPVVDLAAVAAADPGLERWVRARLVPKVLLAPQGRVLEVVVDPTGAWVPSVPVVSIEPLPGGGDPVEALWRIAAVLLSPLVTAQVCRTYAGTGLSAAAIRVAARQVLELPLPAVEARWSAAVTVLRELAVGPTSALDQNTVGDAAREKSTRLYHFGSLMTAAYGQDADQETAADLLEWWTARIGDRIGCYDQLTASSSLRRRSARNQSRNLAL